jgi:uncharacterized membrane protein YgdD (TMEM256/DUF423 family)
MSSALRFFLVFACVSAALSIGVGAIVAHGLTLAAQDAQALAWALDMQRFHAWSLLALVVLARQCGIAAWMIATGGLLVVGTLLFSLNVELRLLHGIELLRPLVPYGGMAFMAGWVAMAMALWKSK